MLIVRGHAWLWAHIVCGRVSVVGVNCAWARIGHEHVSGMGIVVVHGWGVVVHAGWSSVGGGRGVVVVPGRCLWALGIV